MVAKKLQKTAAGRQIWKAIGSNCGGSLSEFRAMLEWYLKCNGRVRYHDTAEGRRFDANCDHAEGILERIKDLDDDTHVGFGVKFPRTPWDECEPRWLTMAEAREHIERAYVPGCTGEPYVQLVEITTEGKQAVAEFAQGDWIDPLTAAGFTQRTPWLGMVQSKRRMAPKGSTMFAHLYISPSAAVRAGKAKFGSVRLDLSEGDLAELTTEERAELAKCVWLGKESKSNGGSPLGYAAGDPDIATADMSAVRAVLQARIAAAQKAEQDRKEKTEKRRQVTLEVLQHRKTYDRDANNRAFAGYSKGELKTGTSAGLQSLDHEVYRCYNARIPAWPYDSDSEITSSVEAKVWGAELDALNKDAIGEAITKAVEAAKKKKAEAEADLEWEKLFREACDAFVAQHGSDSQRERLEAGMLPEDELLDMIRAYLFPVMPRSYGRYAKRDASDIEHDEDCSVSQYGEGSVRFVVFDAPQTDSGTWSRYKTLRGYVGKDAEVTLRVHVGTCNECGAENSWNSARVAYTWHGREFVREYEV